MVSFDEVLPTLVRVCETAPVFPALESLCMVRDLRGRVRLFVKPQEASVDLAPLMQDLREQLGGYFVAPIWQSTAPAEEGRLAAKMIRLATPLSDLVYDDPFSRIKRRITPGRWHKMERRQSKHSWLDTARLRPPWPLAAGKPAIVAFYSFKGGVGRTTALTSMAWQLASEGQRVAILDLDLEAPGAGALMESKSGATARGGIDFIVDYLATSKANLDGIAAPAQALGKEAEYVDVIPAGRLDFNYLEKLARLDFIAKDLFPDPNQSASNIEQALQALLNAVAAELRPQYIFIDARAGLHDLAGLSLSGLAHADVLFSRASEQSYSGLDLTVRMLSQRKIEDLLSVVVHTMAPTDANSQESRLEEAEFLARSYRSFADHVYSALPELPSERDQGAPHNPVVLRFNPSLLHFSSISGLREALFAAGYRELARRIKDLCAPSEETP